MTNAPKPYTPPSAERVALSEQLEAAGKEANRQYVAGLDTTEIDAEVDRLMALLDA